MYKKQNLSHHRSVEYTAGFAHGVYAGEDGISPSIGETRQPADWLIGFKAGRLIRHGKSSPVSGLRGSHRIFEL